MKKASALFTIGTSMFLLATPQVKARVSKTNNRSTDNYKTNKINVIDLQNNLDKNLGQITNVNSLQDVSPTDWAYEALNSLVARYGCIVGFPDQTYRGNQPLSRYEFAAGLNSCLNQIERLIASNDVGSKVESEDLATIQRLSQQFQEELELLNNRVEDLNEKTALLEDTQFSTTTKLNGQAIFSLSGATGGDPELGEDPQIVFNNRLRLDLNTSFSGQDLLITGLQAYNFGGEIDGSGSVQNTLFPTESLLTAGSTKLSFEPQFPRFNPQDLEEEVGNNSVELQYALN